MLPDGVVADTPPEHVPAADQLICESLGVLEDLTFQCRVERLCQRIVGTHPDRSHRLGHLELPAGFLEVPAGVDTAMVGMEDRTGEAATLVLRGLQGFLHQAGAHVIGDREAHEPTRVAVDDRGQVHVRPVGDWQIRDVPDVDSVLLVGGEPSFD